MSEITEVTSMFNDWKEVVAFVAVLIFAAVMLHDFPRGGRWR